MLGGLILRSDRGRAGLVWPEDARRARRKGSTTKWAYDAHAIALMNRFCAQLSASPSNEAEHSIAQSSRLAHLTFNETIHNVRPNRLAQLKEVE